MLFKSIISLVVLAASANAICPGFNYGIADLGSQNYHFYDGNCNVVGTLSHFGVNPCTDGTFSCTPPPVTISGATILGNQYACRPDPNSGSCNNQGRNEVISVCCRNDGN